MGYAYMSAVGGHLVQNTAHYCVGWVSGVLDGLPIPVNPVVWLAHIQPTWGPKEDGGPPGLGMDWILACSGMRQSGSSSQGRDSIVPAWQPAPLRIHRCTTNLGSPTSLRVAGTCMSRSAMGWTTWSPSPACHPEFEPWPDPLSLSCTASICINVKAQCADGRGLAFSVPGSGSRASTSDYPSGSLMRHRQWMGVSIPVTPNPTPCLSKHYSPRY